jgi:hypothetical protein
MRDAVSFMDNKLASSGFDFAVIDKLALGTGQLRDDEPDASKPGYTRKLFADYHSTGLLDIVQKVERHPDNFNEYQFIYELFDALGKDLELIASALPPPRAARPHTLHIEALAREIARSFDNYAVNPADGAKANFVHYIIKDELLHPVALPAVRLYLRNDSTKELKARVAIAHLRSPTQPEDGDLPDGDDFSDGDER